MPTFIEVEYDPFAPVPVEHNPWEGQPDPFAYQPVAAQQEPRWGEVIDITPNTDRVIPAPGQVYPSWTGADPSLIDPGIYATPRPQPAGDELIYAPRDAPPETATNDSWRVPSEPGARLYRDLRNQGVDGAADPEALKSFMRNPEYRGKVTDTLNGLSDPNYLRRISSNGQALDLGYTPPITPEERDQLSQYSLPGDVRPATPPQAWFENTPLWQGNQPEPSEVTRGMSMQGPNPGPTGITGDYYGRGKLKNYIGPQSPLRGTYRYTTPF